MIGRLVENQEVDALVVNESANKIDWKSQKEAQAAKRKKENELKKCEEAITSID